MGSRLILVVAVGILSVTLPACRPIAESADSTCQRRSHFQSRRRADRLCELRGLPSSRRGGAIQPADVRRRPTPREPDRRSHAASGSCRPGCRKEGHGEFRRRATAHRSTNRNACHVGDGRRAARRRGRPARRHQSSSTAGSWARPTWCSKARPTRSPAEAATCFATSSCRSSWTRRGGSRRSSCGRPIRASTHHARLGVDSSLRIGPPRRRRCRARLRRHGLGAGSRRATRDLGAGNGRQPRHRPAPPGGSIPNTCLVLHTHMQPSGKRETVQFRIGLHFADAAAHRAARHPADRQPQHRHSGRRRRITSIVDEYVLPIDVDVHSIFPHAHSLCRKFACGPSCPTARSRPLIWIEHFDEKWHDNYRYVEAGPSAARHEAASPNSPTTTRTTTCATAIIRRERTVYGSNVADEMRTSICK